SAAGYDGIVLMVGENGRAVVYNTVSKVATGKITGTTQRFSSVRWKWEGTEAIVGGDLGQVHIYHRGSGSFHDVTNASFGADPIIAVGVKAPSSPGTAFLLRSTGGTRDVLGYSFDTPVTLDSPSAPQISHYDISVGGQSKKNSMVDAGSTLTFFIDGHYEGGWNNVEIWIEGWHDMGMEGLGSNPPHTPNLWDRNTYFNVSYRSATGWNLNFPNPATPLYPGWENEFQIADYNEAAAFEGDGYEHHYLWLNLTLGSQARAANPGAFNILGDLTPELGFANPNTWDVQMTMQAGGEATRRYTEFGIYKYMGLSVSGSPSGGNVPGEEAKLSPTSVVVVSNTPYSVTLEVSDLSHTLNPVWTIDAENIYVQNHQGERMEGVWTNYGDAAVKTNFLGPNQPLRIWGTDATPYLSPPGYGTTALGQHPGGSLSGQLELLESDPDVGLRLQTLLNASIDQPGEYSLGASAYIDKDLSGDVSTGDRRIFNSSFSSGSWVGDGDMDVGTELFPWSNAKVTGPDGIWDPATETVYDSQDDIAEAQDHRITTFHGFTTIDWWIYIPPGTQEGRYAGTAKLQIYFQP
ncbi:MAG: hypothetical protein QCI38_04915, partial [Candidatus Thermoplasmatota archaeon]|nr:hypothetical protein [Candidatus Thermoplasmatota archaeon]